MLAALALTMTSCAKDSEPAGETGSAGTPTTPSSSAEAVPRASTSVADTLQAVVDSAVATYGGVAGLAVSDGTEAVVAGDDTAYPAWSTIKVPLAIAALRQDPALADQAAAAITYSDNAAAEALWEALPAGAVDEVLREGGAPIAVNTVQLRPEFSVFGQTAWSPSGQATFAANLPCVPGSAAVLELMGQIDPGQSYGLGVLPGARFKGGWGPDTTGAYQVRQFGRVAGPRGDVALALTAIPASGTYADGQAMASMMATQLQSFGLDAVAPAACF